MTFLVAAPMETIWRMPDGVCDSTEKRIVVADDDINAAEAAALVFTEAGFTFHTAYTGLDAVNVAARWRPAAAILDLDMPLGNGWEAADAIRHNDPTLFLVALTADTAYAPWNRSRQGGFDAYFTKPCNFDRLLEIAACRFQS